MTVLKQYFPASAAWLPIIAGAQGAPGATNTQFIYNWSTNTTSADPGSGKMRANATPGTATEIYISLYDTEGHLVVGFSDLSLGSDFWLYEAGDVTRYCKYSVSGSVVISATKTWALIPVTVVNAAGAAPSNNTDVVARFTTPTPPGPPGNTGPIGPPGPPGMIVSGTAPPADTTYLWADTSVTGSSQNLYTASLNIVGTVSGGFVEYTNEQTTDPAAPAADGARVFTKDNGSGKTQLCVRFNTGATVVIATQP